MTLHARPNLNGNTIQDFTLAGISIEATAQAARTALIRARECLHARNYQTVEGEAHGPFGKRAADLARLEAYIASTFAMEEFAADLFVAAVGADA